MAKRRADIQLTREDLDRNDEEDEEDEDTSEGEQEDDQSYGGRRFILASDDILKQRVIKKAKRRSDLCSPEQPSSNPFAILNKSIKNPFAGFLASKPTPPPSSSFLSTPVNSNSMDIGKSDPQKEASPFKPNGSFTMDGKEEEKNDEDNNNLRNPLYYSKLRKLNKSFYKHIGQFIEKPGQDFDFSPCCKDYIRHTEKISKEYPLFESDCNKPLVSNSVPFSETTITFNEPTSTLKISSPIKAAEVSTQSKTQVSSPSKSEVSFGGFKFTQSQPLSGTSNEKKESASTGSSLFAFGTGTGSNTFSFGPSSFSLAKPFGDPCDPADNKTTELKPSVQFNYNPPAKQGIDSATVTQPQINQAEGEGAEEYVPPKAESLDVEEEDAVYSIKCKMFYQKDGKYELRGVGMLHIKKLPTQSYQLLIRSEGSLGLIMLNIALQSKLPITTKKNNVIFSCVPNPPIDKLNQETASILLRVKTVDDAKELMDKMNHFKNLNKSS